MTKTTLFRVLMALAVSAFSLHLAACGDSAEDPAAANSGTSTNSGTTSTNNSTSTNNNTSTNGNTSTNNSTTSTNGGTTSTNNSSTGTNNSTTSTNNSTTSTNNSTTSTNNGSTGTNNNTTPGVCENDWFYGQIIANDGSDPLSPNGGFPTNEPYANDAGLGAVIDAAPAADAEDNSADITTTITEATVIATSFNTSNTQRANRIFWLGDVSGAIKVFFPACVEEPMEEGDIACDDPRYPTFPIKVGQKLSLTATEVTNFGGVIEITNAEGWSLVSEDNGVYVRELAAGEALSMANVNEVVKVTGTLSENSTECGGSSMCWDMDYGAPSTVVFRTSSSFINGGDCITFVGALGTFGGEPQLNVETFDWIWNNTPSE